MLKPILPTTHKSPFELPRDGVSISGSLEATAFWFSSSTRICSSRQAVLIFYSEEPSSSLQRLHGRYIQRISRAWLDVTCGGRRRGLLFRSSASPLEEVSGKVRWPLRSAHTGSTTISEMLAHNRAGKHECRS